MLQTLLTLASERTLEGRFAFGPVMCELLDVACEPFVEVRANEAIIAAAAVGDFLRTVAELIVRFDGHDVSLQLAAAEVLSRFAAETSCELVERSGAAAVLVEALRLEVACEGIASADADADAASTAVDAFAPAKQPSFLLSALVDVLCEVSSFAAGALALASRGGLALVVDILSVGFAPSDPIVSAAIGLLWNALEHSRDVIGASLPCELSSRSELLARFREQNATFCLRSERTLVVLRRILLQLCESGTRATERALRNEVVVVATLIAARSSARKHFAPSGFTAVAIECAVEATWVVHGRGAGTFATKAVEDRELLRLLWLLLARLAEEPSSARLIASSDFVPALVGALQPPYFEPETATRANSPMMMRSSSPHATTSLMPTLRALQSGASFRATYNELDVGTPVPSTNLETDTIALQLIALSVLRRLALVAPPARWAKSSTAQIIDVARKFGASRTSSLWLLAEMCADPGAAPGAAPSERAVATRHELRSLGVVRWGLEVFEDSTLPAAQREAAIVLLCRVCADVEDRAEFRRYFGIGAIVAAIRMHALPTEEQAMLASSPVAIGTARARATMNTSTKALVAEAERESGSTGAIAAFQTQRLIAATVAGVQQLVVGDVSSEEGFLAEGGVDAMVDLCAASGATASGRLTRNQIVGCIADIALSNGDALLAAKAWRGRDSRGVVSLLLSFWAEEEMRRRVPRGDSGQVIDPAHPLDAATSDGSGSGADGSPESTSNLSAISLRASQRLRRALQASRTVGFETRVPSEAARKAVEGEDLRSKVWAALCSMYPDGDFTIDAAEQLTSAEQLNLCVASRYDSFRSAQEWRDVHNALVRQRLNPIAADAIFLKAQLAKADEDAAAVVEEQADILAARVRDEQKSEMEYHREVQERAKAIGMQDKMAMMAALGGPTMEQRKAAKVRRKAMMAKSGMVE